MNVNPRVRDGFAFILRILKGCKQFVKEYLTKLAAAHGTKGNYIKGRDTCFPT